MFKFPLAFIVSFYADDGILSMKRFSENQVLLQLWINSFISFLPSWLKLHCCQIWRDRIQINMQRKKSKKSKEFQLCGYKKERMKQMTTFRFYIVRWLNLFHVFKGEIENMQKGHLDKRNWET